MIGAVLALALAATPAPLAPTWTPDLGDPVLGDLLARADRGSLDVKMALARLEKAGADVDLARAGRRPHVSVGVEAAAGAANFSSHAEGAGVPAQASYEVDLFGRLKAQVAAAKADQAAAEADVQDARRLVLAETAKAYVDLRAAQARRTAAEASLITAQRAQDLMLRRQSEGDVTGEDVVGARQAVREATLNRDAARHTVEAARIRLGLLVGDEAPIAEPAAVGSLPVTPAIAQLPSEAVLARPDIQAAQARLYAADARRAEAVAAARPSFSLTATLGGGEPDLLYLLDVRALAWSIAGGLTHQLFDGGAGKARKRGAAAEADLAELAYRKTVGEAWAQARLGLGVLDQATTAETLARETLADAERARTRGEVRYREGDIDGADLARLDSAVAGARGALAEASAARARAYLDLSLALGGRA